MAKTLITLHLEMGTTSLSRVGDFMDDLATLMASKKVKPINTTIYQEAGNAQSDGTVGRDVGRARSEAGERAREDFGSEADADAGAGAAADAPAGKRGRGRPRKQRDGDAPEAGSASGSEQQRDGAGRTEGGGRNVARGTDAGTEQGGAEGEGRARSSRADRGTERGNSDQARISTGGDRGEAGSEWDDAAPETANTPRRSKDDKDNDGPAHHAKVPDKAGPNDTVDFIWPDHLMPEEVTQQSLSELLAQHFEAAGGKSREVTFDIMQQATGVRKLSEVHEDDYDNLAAGLLKDIARHKHGIKATIAK